MSTVLTAVKAYANSGYEAVSKNKKTTAAVVAGLALAGSAWYFGTAAVYSAAAQGLNNGIEFVSSHKKEAAYTVAALTTLVAAKVGYSYWTAAKSAPTKKEEGSAQ